MELERRLRRVEEWAASRPEEDELADYDFERLNLMETGYFIWLGERQSSGAGPKLSRAERRDRAQLLALARGELTRERFPCRGVFTCVDFQRSVWGFAPCPECGRAHPAPDPLPQRPPFAAWAHLLPEESRDPGSVWRLSFYVRPGGEVIGYLRY